MGSLHATRSSALEVGAPAGRHCAAMRGQSSPAHGGRDEQLSLQQEDDACLLDCHVAVSEESERESFVADLEKRDAVRSDEVPNPSQRVEAEATKQSWEQEGLVCVGVATSWGDREAVPDRAGENTMKPDGGISVAPISSAGVTRKTISDVDTASSPLASESDGPGHMLRQARAAQGVSLEELAIRTKISRAQLEKIERQEFEKLAGPVFVKGFLRCCARALQLDEQAVLRSWYALEEERSRPNRTGSDTGDKVHPSTAPAQALRGASRAGSDSRFFARLQDRFTGAAGSDAMQSRRDSSKEPVTPIAAYVSPSSDHAELLASRRRSGGRLPATSFSSLAVERSGPLTRGMDAVSSFARTLAPRIVSLQFAWWAAVCVLVLTIVLTALNVSSASGGYTVDLMRS